MYSQIVRVSKRTTFCEVWAHSLRLSMSLWDTAKESIDQHLTNCWLLNFDWLVWFLLTWFGRLWILGYVSTCTKNYMIVVIGGYRHLFNLCFLIPIRIKLWITNIKLKHYSRYAALILWLWCGSNRNNILRPVRKLQTNLCTHSTLSLEWTTNSSHESEFIQKGFLNIPVLLMAHKQHCWDTIIILWAGK